MSCRLVLARTSPGLRTPYPGVYLPLRAGQNWRKSQGATPMIHEDPLLIDTPDWEYADSNKHTDVIPRTKRRLLRRRRAIERIAKIRGEMKEIEKMVVTTTTEE